MVHMLVNRRWKKEIMKDFIENVSLEVIHMNAE